MAQQHIKNGPTSNVLTLQALVQKLSALSDIEEAHLQLVDLMAGDVLFEQGDLADGIYILVAGMLGVRRRHEDGSETEIDRLDPGAVVGELALLSEQSRTATVYAVNDCGLLRLTNEAFAQLTEAEQEAITDLKLEKAVKDLEDVVVSRWHRLQLASGLNQLLGELDANELHMLQAQLEWHHLSNGDVLFQQDEPSDGMYIVLNGRLQLTLTDHNKNTLFSSEIKAGETIGGLSFVANERRLATVLAVGAATLVKLTAEQLSWLAQKKPHMINRLNQHIIKQHVGRLKEAQSYLRA